MLWVCRLLMHRVCVKRRVSAASACAWPAELHAHMQRLQPAAHGLLKMPWRACLCRMWHAGLRARRCTSSASRAGPGTMRSSPMARRPCRPCWSSSGGTRRGSLCPPHAANGAVHLWLLRAHVHGAPTCSGPGVPMPEAWKLLSLQYAYDMTGLSGRAEHAKSSVPALR